jgi:hypothetical protein
MSFRDFTPEEEDQLSRDLAAAQTRVQAIQTASAPTLAENIAKFYRLYPDANLGTVIPAARAYTDGVMSEGQASEFLKAVIMRELKDSARRYQEGQKDKSWWERNVLDKAKSAARWGFAAVEAVPQFVQNIGSRAISEVYETTGLVQEVGTTGRIPTGANGAPVPAEFQYKASQVFGGGPGFDFKPGQGGFLEGSFIATDLGTLIANDEVAGEGWFIGGRAKDLQAERARQYRGTIEGHAFTLGRGTASFMAQPGSDTYNKVSGFIDIAAAVLTPAAPGLKVAKAVVAPRAANVLGLRTLAGIVDAESAAFDPKKVLNFLTSRSGKKVIDRMIDIESVDEAMEIFSGTTDAKFLLNLVDVAAKSRVLREAGNQNYADEMQMFFRDTFGLQDITRGIAPSTIEDINISRFSDLRRNAWKVGTERESKVARLMGQMYGRDVIVAGGSQREIMMSIRNVKEMLRSVKVDPAKRAELVRDFTDALVRNNGEVGKVVNEFNNILREQFKSLKVGDELTDQLIEGIGKTKVIYKDRLYGFIDGSGLEYSFADKGAKFITIDGDVFDAPLATAGLQSEMLKHSLILPDARRVRRIASQYSVLSAITTKQKLTRGVRNELAGKFEFVNDATKYGELRIPFAALEFLQNQVWRPLTLMTYGYIFRNMADSGLRAAFAPQMQTSAFHPLQHILAVTHKRYKGDIEGMLFDEDMEDLIRLGHREYAEAINASVVREMDPRVRYAHEKATGVWADVRLSDGINDFAEGVMAEVSLLATDELAIRVARGDSMDELIRWLEKDPRGKNYARSLQARWSNVEAANSTTGVKEVVTFKFIDPATGKIEPKQFETFIQNYIRNYISASTGDNAVLADIIGRGRFLDSNGNIQEAFKYSRSGEIAGFTKAFRREVIGIIKDPTNRLKETYKRQIYVTPKGTTSGLRDDLLMKYDKAVDAFFGVLYGKPEAYLNRSPAFRQFYYGQIGRFLDELLPGESAKILSMIKFSAKKQLDDEISQLSKLRPDANGVIKYKGKEISSQRVAELIGKKKSQLDEITNRLNDPAKEQAYVARYVGDADLAKRIIGKAKGSTPSNGKISLEELNQLARGYALDETQKLFYNAAERSNFADVYRIIAPFGSAWYEVTKRWGKQMATNPEILKRGSVTVQGLRDYDPDNDGKGFFWRDPTTGEYVFNYPFSPELASFFPAAALGTIGTFAGGAIAGPIGAAAGLAGGVAAGLGVREAAPQAFGGGAALEGINAQLVAPVKSLSMGFNYIPGVGPYVQVAASKILGNKPDLDWLNKMLLPYGEPDVSFVTLPSWSKKFYESFWGNTDNDRLLGDTTIDIQRVLATSGKYDLTTEEGKLELEKDAEAQARYVLTLRWLGQFTGPTRPKVDYVIDTKDGDKMASELSKAVYDMRANDPDGYVKTFMETFGDDFYLYFAGKSRTIAGGLDASTEFGKWERNNESLIAKYPEVAGYFAPEVGSKFDYQVFVRQLENSRLRVKNKPQDVIDIAQRIVGTAMVRYARKQFGDKLDDNEKEILADIRKDVENKYPGYKYAPMDVKNYENRLQLAESAAFNAPELRDNPVGEGARLYFAFRQEMAAISELRGNTLSAKDNADLRGRLFAYGEQLATQIPEFARMWDALLVDEVID